MSEKLQAKTPENGRRAVNGESSNADTDVRHLFLRLHGPSVSMRAGDRESLRDHLVMIHTPLVEHCARNFLASGEPIDDLIQEGYVGLIKAVDRFDATKGVRFSTYACHLITGEIRHYLRDLGRLIHEPGWHFELRQRIARTNDQLTQKLGRAPDAEEIALALNIDPKSVRDVQRNQQTLTVEYYDAESERESDDSGGASDWESRLFAAFNANGAAEAQVEDQLMLGSALPQLRDLEKRAVMLFFFEDLSKTEVARRLNVSINHASYLIKRGVDGLRRIIDASEGDVAMEDTSAAELKRIAHSRLRAAYLMERAKEGLSPESKEESASEAKRPRRSRRRTQKLLDEIAESGITPTRSGVASFSEFALWVDDEARRAEGYAHEFALTWLRVPNWDEVVASLTPEQQEEALASMQALTRRSCRATDQLASLVPPPAEFPGLNFLVLMPFTGSGGVKLGERWLKACEGYQLLPDAGEKAASLLTTQFAFVVFPHDGRKSDELFRALGAQFGSTSAGQTASVESDI